MKKIASNGEINKIVSIKPYIYDTSCGNSDVKVYVATFKTGNPPKRESRLFNFPSLIEDYNDIQLELEDNHFYFLQDPDEYLMKIGPRRKSGNSISKITKSDEYGKVLIDCFGNTWLYDDWLHLVDNDEEETKAQITDGLGRPLDEPKEVPTSTLSEQTATYTLKEATDMDGKVITEKDYHLYVIRVGTSFYLTKFKKSDDGNTIVSTTFERDPANLPILRMTELQISNFANEVGGIAIRLDINKEGKKDA